MQEYHWEFHDYNLPYVTGAIRKAREYGVTHVVFSHRLVYNTEELLVDHYRSRHIEQLTAEAHRQGIKALFWTHEISQVPEGLLREGKADLDKEELWEYLTHKYERAFQRVPHIDGMVLTLRETPYAVFLDDRAASSMCKAERVAKLINCLFAVCRKHGKELIVRTFVYEPGELAWVKEGLEQTPDAVVVQTKEIPHDWQPFYPHNALINAFPTRKHLLETHLAAENGGGDDLLYCHPGYTKYRFDYSRRNGMNGVVARVDWGEAHALGGPNEINIYAASRYLQEPGVSPDTVWHEWACAHYGAPAAPYVVSALCRTFDICNKTFHVKGFWYTKSSPAGYEYIRRSLWTRSSVKWDPTNRELKELEYQLQHPTPETLQAVLAEKDEAIALARATIADIDKAGFFTDARKYQVLKRRAELLWRISEIWRGLTQAYFGLRVFEETGERSALATAVNGVDAMERWISEVDTFWQQPQRWQGVHGIARDFAQRIAVAKGE